MATKLNDLVCSGEENGFKVMVGDKAYVFKSTNDIRDFVMAYFTAWQSIASWPTSAAEQGTSAAVSQQS